MHVWVPCSRRAARGSLFCLAHEDSLHGAFLGLCVRGFPERAGAASVAEYENEAETSCDKPSKEYPIQ